MNKLHMFRSKNLKMVTVVIPVRIKRYLSSRNHKFRVVMTKPPQK
jgi:hypothetical protein